MVGQDVILNHQYLNCFHTIILQLQIKRTYNIITAGLYIVGYLLHEWPLEGNGLMHCQLHLKPKSTSHYFVNSKYTVTEAANTSWLGNKV